MTHFSAGFQVIKSFVVIRSLARCCHVRGSLYDAIKLYRQALDIQTGLEPQDDLMIAGSE